MSGGLERIRWGCTVGGALLVSVALGIWIWRPAWQSSRAAMEHRRRVDAELPRPSGEGGYITSHRCQSCHPGEHASWHRTYHRTMTQPAVAEAVLGRFDGETVVSGGLEYRVWREGEAYWAEMPDPDEMMYVVQGGKRLAPRDIPRVKLPVVMTTGSHHYQTYWVASERYDRLLQTLPLVYLRRDQRWIPREAAFMLPPGHGPQMITQWNHHCIRCHSTGGNPGLNTQTGRLETRVGEFGIACESCHGPAERHVAKHQNPLTRYRHHLSGAIDDTIVNPSRLDSRRSSQVCGQCHGVFTVEEEFATESATRGVLYHPGEDLERTRYYIQHPAVDPTPQRKEELERNPDFFRERWWDDGTVLAGGREYTAMAATGCFLRGGMSCLSCHSMHQSDPNDQLKAGMEGNAACTQCHRESKYADDLSRHTFHRAASSGSQCQNCHMPHTTYALLGAIRSHQIDRPRPLSSARHGVPNACNLCHLDRTLAWTQDRMAEWYHTPKVDLSEEQRTLSASLLWLLKGDAAQRVIAAWHFGWGPALEASGRGWQAPFLALTLRDPYGVVRYVAAASLAKLPGFSSFRFDFLAPSEGLARSSREAVALWSGQSKPPDRTGGEVLLNEDGTPQEAATLRLVQQRDNRPVRIKE